MSRPRVRSAARCAGRAFVFTDRGAGMPKAIALFIRATDRLSDWTGTLAMYLIFVMVAVLLLDAVTRNILDDPLHWCLEFAQFTLAAYYFMGGAKTLKDNDHVRMDLFYENLSARGKARMDLVTVGCLIFYLVVMLIGSVSSLTYSIETNQRLFSIWNPSVVPIKALMVGCIVLMLLQSVGLFFKYLEASRERAIG
jgi:TRAP-type mannitol/chloroaromatic compound transport system permease small subunit